MALDLDATYTPRSKVADADYPQGSFKNATTPLTGTPFDEDWANDFLGFFQKLIDFGNITPSGVPDTVLASDFFDGMVKRINRLSQYLVDSGVADAYVVTGDPVYTAYFDGMKLRVKIGNLNTGASTINVDSLGTKNIVKYVSTPLVAGDLPANAIAELQYDGTSFQLQHVHNISQTLTSLTLTGAAASPPAANTLVKDNIIKGWISFDGTGAVSINDSYNVSSLVDNGTGDYTVNWDRDFTGTHSVAGMCNDSVNGAVIHAFSVVVGSTNVRTRQSTSATLTDSSYVSVIAIGDQ